MSKEASCQSLLPGILSAAKKFANEYQEFRKTAAGVLVKTLIPGTPKYEEEVVKLTNKIIDLQTRMISSYGEVVGDGKGTIGARHITVPVKRITGHLLTERTFFAGPIGHHKIKITIKKTGGKAGARIAACAKYANGDRFNEKHNSIDKGRDNVGEEANLHLWHMEGMYLTIHIVQEGFPTDFFDYDLSITGEFNQDKLQESAKAA